MQSTFMTSILMFFFNVSSPLRLVSYYMVFNSLVLGTFSSSYVVIPLVWFPLCFPLF